MRRLLGVIVLGAALLTPLPAQAAPADRQQAFAVAAEKYGVPESVLLAVSYLQSRWDDHRGSPSSAGGYGPMNLTDARYVLASHEFGDDPRGDESRPLPAAAAPDVDAPSMRTLPEAATLTGTDPAVLRTDASANIAGGAALLARYQRDLGFSSVSPGDWYATVARYSGATTVTGARQFADDVFDVIRTGMSRRTVDGQQVSLPATDVTPATSQLSALRLSSAETPLAECPSTVDCDFIPAAYAQNGATIEKYGNYDWAHRPTNLKIQYIVIHDQEGYYNGTVSWFQNPKAKVAAHYVMRSTDGHITQMVKNSDVGWQAGNWYFNAHSIGIEHEGFAAAGATWYTEAMYRQSAKLVRFLAQRYDIPLDRQHIIAHGNVPGLIPEKIPAMHWDPGPYWDWNHYLDLLHATPRADRHGGLLTISPDFASNQPPVTGCDKSGSGNACTPQASNFVYLRESPSPDAPLVVDAGLGAGAYDISDWGARAEAGQQFASAGRSGDWSAVWYLGRKAWFLNPRKAPTAYASRGFTVTPRRGLASIQVFGCAYPESSAYSGSPVPVQPVTPLPYTISAGQRYALGEWRVPTDYYYAKTIDSSYPGDHTVVRGKTRYLEIQFNHRVAFVKASDVQLLPY